MTTASLVLLLVGFGQNPEKASMVEEAAIGADVAAAAYSLHLDDHNQLFMKVAARYVKVYPRVRTHLPGLSLCNQRWANIGTEQRNAFDKVKEAESFVRAGDKLLLSARKAKAEGQKATAEKDAASAYDSYFEATYAYRQAISALLKSGDQLSRLNFFILREHARTLKPKL